jgi:MAC/Perforin domain-containing protein
MTTSENTALEPGAPDANLVPGAGMLGFGINIASASSLTSTTQRCVSLDDADGTTVTLNGVTYLMPKNVSMDETPASSTDLNLFASQSDYSKHMAVETQASASAWGFSGAFAATYSSVSQGESSKYYGLVEANTTLWNVTVDEIQGASLMPAFQSELAALPDTFTPENQQQFYDFFVKYGTHIITSAQVGGSLYFLVTVSSASQLDSSAASMSMSAEYKSLAVDVGGSVQADWDSMASSWICSRHATLSTVGGEPSVLADAAPSTDPTTPVNYQGLVTDWAKSVEGVPAVTGTHLQPIYEVAPTSQIAALEAALSKYLNASAGATAQLTFGPDPSNPVPTSVSCTVTIDDVSPTPPTGSGLQPMYWLLLADDEGSIRFNENALQDDPAAFDSLIADAVTASQGQEWWAVVVISSATKVPTGTALAWLESCGIPITSADFQYPGAPEHLVAAGRTNSPTYAGSIDTDVDVDPANWPTQPSLKVAVPLFAATVD